MKLAPFMSAEKSPFMHPTYRALFAVKSPSCGLLAGFQSLQVFRMSANVERSEEVQDKVYDEVVWGETQIRN